MSLWVVANLAATVYQIFGNGRTETIRPMFGPPTGILVSDRATVFSFWRMKRRQVCLAHLLRKFVAFSENEGRAGELGRSLLECTVLIFEYWHGYKDGLLPRDEMLFWMRPVQRAFERFARARGQGRPQERIGLVTRPSGAPRGFVDVREPRWRRAHQQPRCSSCVTSCSGPRNG
jgi:transposase